MTDKHAASANWASWTSAAISLIALGLSFAAYRESVKPEPLLVRFRYINVSLGGPINDPFAKLREVTNNKISIVENDVFATMEDVVAPLREYTGVDPWGAPTCRFLVLENVSAPYFESVTLTITRTVTDDDSNSTSRKDRIEVAGLKSEEFIAVPLSMLAGFREHNVQIQVSSVVVTSNGRSVEFLVRAEFEAKVNIFGARAGV